jgi:Fe-S cluster assembly iron-binding protein IscA
MLTLTDHAATIVKDLTGRATGTEAGGLRIATHEADTSNFDVTVIPAPQPEDLVVENDGAHVFLEKNAADALADKQLDATIDDEGAVRFSIASRV